MSKGLRVVVYTLKLTSILVIVALLVMIVIVWRIASDVAQPERRQLQEYHQHWLNHAQAEGINITAYPCANGQAPCLFITPHIPANSTTTARPILGERGQLIRQQLQQDFNHKLPAYASTAQHPQGIIVLLHGRQGRKEDLLPVAARFVAVGFVAVVLDLPAHGDSPLEYSGFGTELAEQMNDTQRDMINQSLANVRAWLKTQAVNTDKSSLKGNLVNGNIGNGNGANNNPQAELPAFLWAMSMGGSYAMHSLAQAEQQNNWQGVIIVSSFARLNELAERQVEHMTSALPKPLQAMFKPLLLNMFAVFVEWQGGIEPDKVNPANLAAKVSLPLFMLHGDQDRVIDITQGKALYDAYASQTFNQSANQTAHKVATNNVDNTAANIRTVTVDKTWLTVQGANHHNVLVTEAPVYATMADWLLRHTRQPETNTANSYDE